MFNYLRYLIQRGVEYNIFINEKDSVVDIVLNYIHQHYSEDISRTMLADMVYLNPDYLARLFKKTNADLYHQLHHHLSVRKSKRASAQP